MSVVKKVLPTNWMNTNLVNVCEILDSVRVPVNAKERNNRTTGKSKEQLYPYYGATGKVGEIDGYLFDGEYLLLGEDGAPFLDSLKNTAYIVSGKFWVNNHAHILKASISNKYLCHYLNQYDFSKSVTGTTRLKLNQSALKDIAILFAPEKEQHRIVEKIEELFSELDKGIESLKTAREQLKVYRQALLKHAFEGKLTEQWREENADKLETADQLLSRIQQEREIRYQQQLDTWNKAVKKWEAGGKEGKKPAKPRQFVEPNFILQEILDELAVLPVDWKWCKIGHMFDVYVGSTPSRKNPNFWNGDIHWVSSGEVAFCHINETDEKITEEGYTNASTQIHPIGTIMLAMIGEGKTRGQAAVLNIEAAHNQNTAAIRVSETDCNILLFYYYLLYQYELTRKLGSGNNQKALNKDRVSNMLFPLPPIDEQTVIASQVDEKISVIEKIDIEILENLNRAEALRQSILKKAFSGQLVSQDPTDEPASVLLEHIKAEKESLKKIAPKKKKTARRKNAA